MSRRETSCRACGRLLDVAPGRCGVLSRLHVAPLGRLSRLPDALGDTAGCRALPGRARVSREHAGRVNAPHPDRP